MKTFESRCQRVGRFSARSSGTALAHESFTTTSADFPVSANAVQRSYGGGGYRANNGGGPTGDAFVAKLNPSGSALEFSTYLGGDGDESANGIAVDTAGNIFIMGITGSTNFPR